MTIHRRHAGFTLLETILSLALTALLVAMLSTLGKQWLLDWNRGTVVMGDIDQVMLAQDRIAKDVSAALALPASPVDPDPNFIGESLTLTFIRPPRSGDNTDRLVVVQYRTDDERGVTRRIAPYDGITPVAQSRFGEAVMLLPPPFRLSFHYARHATEPSANWREGLPPDRVTIALTKGDNTEFPSRPVTLHVTIPAACANAGAFSACQILQHGKTLTGQVPPPDPNSKAAPKGSSAP